MLKSVHSRFFKIVVSVWLGAMLVLAVFSFPIYLFRAPGYDFMLRVNEVETVAKGIDPYDIFSLKIPSDVYYPLNRPDLRTETRNKFIHAYPPWSYAYFLPFAVEGDVWTKWYVWAGVEFLCFLGMLYYAVRRGWLLNHDKWEAAFVLAAALSLGVTLGPNFGNGNYTYPLTILIPVFAYLLCGRREFWAGICWALLMVKPQDAVLLGIPILLARKWKVCLVAISFCLLAGEVSALMIKKNLLTLILKIPEQGSPFFGGTMLLPPPLCELLKSQGVPKNVILYCSVLVGIVFCSWLCWKVRDADDWLVRLAPAIICASAWTYMLPGDRALFYAVQILFAERFLSAATKSGRIAYGISIVVVFFSCLMTLTTCSDLLGALGSAVGIPRLFELTGQIVPMVDVIAGWGVLAAVVHFCLDCSRPPASSRVVE